VVGEEKTPNTKSHLLGVVLCLAYKEKTSTTKSHPACVISCSVSGRALGEGKDMTMDIDHERLGTRVSFVFTSVGGCKMPKPKSH